MAAKTYLIVDAITEQPVGLYTCDEDPELAMPFGGYNQHLVDDTAAVEAYKAERGLA